MLYIETILPLPLAGTFTYSIDDEIQENIVVGMRVIVSFGKKYYTAIVKSISEQKPDVDFSIKAIVCTIDDKPVINQLQLHFWDWIAEYYQANLGDIYQAAVPSGLKIESKAKVFINRDFECSTPLSDRENRVLDALSPFESLSVDELNKRLSINNCMPALKLLVEKGAVEISEEITEKFRPRSETVIRFGETVHSEVDINILFDEIAKNAKQKQLLLQFLELTDGIEIIDKKEISKKELLKSSGCSTSVLSSLEKKNILASYSKTIGRLDFSQIQTIPPAQLNEYQQIAIEQIKTQFVEKNVVLLQGITSSGKTEIYIHLLKTAIENGKTALLLVPEIALTTQLTTRLIRIFGNRLGVYHSKFSDAERVEIWNNVLEGKRYDVIVGVRSSVFLPFQNLGLIIVDEEHETSYKQSDTSPHYHARNAAIVLASFHQAKTLLGSATPSVESYYNAKAGKYGLTELSHRYQDMQLPEIMLIDLADAYKKKRMTGHFSNALLEKIGATLQANEQIIIFQNRRGYSPYLECKACSYVPKCKNCDVSLTMHKYLQILTCHYCGYTETIPHKCPVCNADSLTNRGFGTEKVEDEIHELFPSATVARMDLDTTHTKKSYTRIITDFENHNTDILVGTQMVTKGLDFDNVGLVAVLNADNLLNMPDFRANERAFQLLMQVGGRAGRKKKRGLVVIQTSQPSHPIIKNVVNYDYISMFNTQISERHAFRYPPFYRLITLTLKHKNPDVVKQAAQALVENLRKVFGVRVLGPNDPLIARIQTYYIKQIILKIEISASHQRAKEIIKNQINQIKTIGEYRQVLISVDVDPM
ncbi:MAG: primosomal protein N' [Paludibacter sp.]|jgi:primosomal protein N' (replication factor Y)|nr:primosomal protein N' [Paludibacter sp.]